MFTLFKTFFLLGLMSFGGPAAHIGYFRQMFVERKDWLTEQEYAQLIALSQFLPGPGSSQVGFAIGYQKYGVLGGILAFIGFTLPSFILMIIIASISTQFLDTSLWQSLVYGLKILAVVVVADACISMYHSFCKTQLTVGLCVFTACFTWLLPSIWTQIITLALAALISAFIAPSCSDTAPPTQVSPSAYTRIQIMSGGLFAVFFFLFPWITHLHPLMEIFANFFQAGSLVFGGGHVVLPLLQSMLPEQISSEQFLTGYAAAQAIPGPMFTLATYLGYLLMPTSPLLGASIATLGIFLPGFLLIILFFRHWQQLSQGSTLIHAISGINAAVVGLLIAAFYQPVFSSAIHAPSDMVWVLLGLFALRILKVRILFLVASFLFLGLSLYYF